MNQPFNHILTINFKHQYFSNNQFKSIQISLTKETSKHLLNLGIIIKNFPAGLHLLTSEPELLESSDETEPIRLLLNCKDETFINYTELPPYHLGTNILYFNNLNVNSKTKDGSILLHENEVVTQNEVVPVSNGKLTLPQFDASKKYSFTDVAGNEITTQNIRQTSNDSADFNLFNLPEGKIIINDGKKEAGKVYYHANTVWKKPLGILEIFPGKLFEHYKKKGKLEYNINFNNRQTIWKYFFVNPVYQKFDNLAIINKSKEQVFKKPEKKQFHEKMEAVVFESKNRIPISEFSNHTFQLVEGYDPKLKSGKVILKNLASASPDLLYRDETNSGETIYSHIFI